MGLFFYCFSVLLFICEPCEVLEDYEETTIEDPTSPVGIRQEYRWKLSDISTTKDYLGFYLVHQNVQVTIDGEPVYSLAPSAQDRIGTSSSSNWVFIPLDRSDNGREVVVTVTPVYKSVGNREIQFLLGDRSDMVLGRLKADLPQIVVSVLCVFIGIVLMIVQPILILRKRSNSWKLFHLGNFLLLLGIWRITDTRFSSIFFSANTMALGYISLAALFIAAAPLLLFMQEHFAKRKKAVLLTVLAVCVSALAALVCQVLRIAELRETLILCHIMLIVCMAVLLLVSLVHTKKDAGKREILGLAFLLIAGCIADLLFFYINKTSAGIIFTMIALLIYTVGQFIMELLNIHKKVSIDARTGLLNRNHWNDVIGTSLPDSKAAGVMMLDLNGLKRVNELMKKADEKMYFNKIEWYQKNVPDGKLR